MHSKGLPASHLAAVLDLQTCPVASSFYRGSGDLNSDPNTWLASTSATEPSGQSLLFCFLDEVSLYSVGLPRTWNPLAWALLVPGLQGCFPCILYLYPTWLTAETKKRGDSFFFPIETGGHNKESSTQGPLIKIGPFYTWAFQMPLYLGFCLWTSGLPFWAISLCALIFTNKGSQAVLASRETPRANQIIVLVSLIVIEKPDDESIDNQHGNQGQDTGENNRTAGREWRWQRFVTQG